MNLLYAVNFAPGFEELTARLFSEIDVDLIHREEGFMLVKFPKMPDLGRLGFIKSFIRVFDYGKATPELSLKLPDDFRPTERERFNIRYFEGNKPSKLDSIIKEELIKEICSKTNLRYSAFEPQVDFVLAKRRDGLCFFGVKEVSRSLNLEKGELHPDIVNLLCRLGEIKDGAKVLDAFSGYGGIAKGVLESFNPNSVVLVEKDSKLINRLKLKFKRYKEVKVVAGDSVKYLNNQTEKYNLILADPPWGDFDNYDGDIKKLYTEFLQAAKDKLESEGKIVIISSKKEDLEKAAVESGLSVLSKLNVLISGKKVLVLKLGSNG